MNDSKIARVAKGKRPIYFADPATDKLMSMLLTVVGELSVCRDRIDSLERLLQQKDIVAQGEVDSFTPDADATGKPNMTEVSKLDTGSQLCSSINISADVSDFQQTYVADY